MHPNQLSLFPLLRQLQALDLPAGQMMMLYPWACFVCAVSAVMPLQAMPAQVRDGAPRG